MRNLKLNHLKVYFTKNFNAVLTKLGKNAVILK